IGVNRSREINAEQGGSRKDALGFGACAADVCALAACCGSPFLAWGSVCARKAILFSTAALNRESLMAGTLPVVSLGTSTRSDLTGGTSLGFLPVRISGRMCQQYLTAAT